MPTSQTSVTRIKPMPRLIRHPSQADIQQLKRKSPNKKRGSQNSRNSWRLAGLSRPDFTVDGISVRDNRMEVLFTFHANDAEMYLGNTPVSVDMGTALYMLQQKDSMPRGQAWGDSFPAVVNHTSSSVARHHPDFLAAKRGDFDAAIRLVDDLVKDEKVMDVATRFPEAHVAYIHRQNGTGINMIPAAFAAKFSAAGMTVENDIIAITNVSHTDASDVARLSRRMRFEGNVTKGASYIILDDFITSGAELRDMRDYISSKGGNVVMITTFGHGSFGKLTDIRIDNDYKNKLKEAGITDQDLRKYGIASEIGCLTISEAAKLSRVVNASAKRQTPQVVERFSVARQEQSTVSAMAGEVPKTERQDAAIIVPTISNTSFLRR